jgi:uncharacterized protein YlaI
MNFLSWIMLAAGLPLLTVLGYAVLQRVRRQAVEPVHRFLCPHCRHRLGYQAHQAGRVGICPHCRHRIAFRCGTVKWAPRRK